MKLNPFAPLLALGAIAILIAACGGPASTNSTSGEAQKFASLKGDSTKGKAKYLSTCSACHGVDAKGLTALGKDLTSNDFTKKLSDPELINLVVKGRSANDPANTTHVEMPPKGGNPALTDQDIADIVAFVRSVQK